MSMVKEDIDNFNQYSRQLCQDILATGNQTPTDW